MKTTVKVTVLRVEAVNGHVNNVTNDSRVVVRVADNDIATFGRDHFSIMGSEWAKRGEAWALKNLQPGMVVTLSGVIKPYGQDGKYCLTAVKAVLS